MVGIGAHIISLLGVVSIISLMIAVILLLHLIQQAFDRAGVIWGMISMIYPPGTYLYCRKNWDTLRPTFIWISGLLVVSMLILLTLKMI